MSSNFSHKAWWEFLNFFSTLFPDISFDFAGLMHCVLWCSMSITGYMMLYLHILQTAVASLEWSQLWFDHPLWPHIFKLLSLPIHFMSSSQICPLPDPNEGNVFVAPAYPSCLHTTWASYLSHPSLQTVPQYPTRNTSTRPWYEDLLPTKRTS